MSLPATDNFNRADEDPIGGNWTPQSFTPDEGRIVDNAYYSGPGSTFGSASLWNADTFNNDQYSQIVLGASPDNGYSGPTVRASGTGSSRTCYIGMILTANRARIYKLVNSASDFPGTLVADLGTPSFVAGDIIKLMITGTTLELFQNGVSLGTGTDSDITSGSAGIWAFGVSLDNWEGGNVGVAATNKSRLSYLGAG